MDHIWSILGGVRVKSFSAMPARKEGWLSPTEKVISSKGFEQTELRMKLELLGQAEALTQNFNFKRLNQSKLCKQLCKTCFVEEETICRV